MQAKATRLTEVEIALAHAERALEELSDLVREQETALRRAERRIAALAERLGALEARGPDDVADPGHEVPPHW